MKEVRALAEEAGPEAHSVGAAVEGGELLMRIVAQHSASWNQVAGWLSRLGDPRAHFPALA